MHAAMTDGMIRFEPAHDLRGLFFRRWQRSAARRRFVETPTL